MLARKRVKWLMVGSRQESERTMEKEEKKELEEERQEGEEEGKLLEGGVEGLGVPGGLITIEPDCDHPGEVTRLARGACHVDPNRSHFPVRFCGK